MKITKETPNFQTYLMLHFERKQTIFKTDIIDKEFNLLTSNILRTNYYKHYSNLLQKREWKNRDEVLKMLERWSKKIN